jgi:hypothetical protein
MRLSFPICVFLVLLVLAGLRDSNAQCDCAYVGPDSKDVEVAFVGTIHSIEADESGNKYTIKISEIFRGLDRPTTVEAIQGSYSCNSRRHVGREYLFMATRDENGRIKIIGCSYSYRNAHKQRQMIEIFRWMRDSPNEGGIIVGMVSSPTVVERVFLENDKGEKREAKVEPDGFYRFTSLSDGSYRLYISLPKTLTTYGDVHDFDNMKSNRPGVAVAKGQGRIEDFQVSTNGVVSGRVSAQDGMPINGITVSLVSLDDDYDDSTEADEDGQYTFTGVPPGKYTIRVGAADWYVSPDSVDAIYPITFYGDHRLRRHAKELNLKSSQVLNDVDIKRIPQLGKKVLRGRVLMPDGKPAQNADVTVQIRRRDPNQTLRSGWHVMTSTDSNGNFELDVYDETDYLLKADIDKPTGSVTVEVLFSSECFQLPKSRPVSPISIRLKPGHIKCVVEKFGF